MPDSLQQMLGKVFGIQDLSEIQWKLGNDLSPTLLAIILIAALVFAVWSYYYEGASERRALLIGLRLTSIILLLLVLLQPSIALKHEEEGESRVYTILDSSQSMGLTDGGQQSRWQLATDALTAQEGLLNQLDDDHHVEIMTVGDELLEATPESLLKESPSSPRSALGLALNEMKEKDATAVVLLSDMAWNEGADPVIMSSRLGNQGVPVFTVPVGTPNSPDAEVLSVHIRDRVFPGEELPIKVQLAATEQLEGISTDLVIRVDDQELSRQSVTHIDGQQLIEIPVKGPNLKGRAKISVELEALEQEVSDVNNLHEQTITFLEEKIKVLYVEGAPRWEYRYLRTVLLRDPRLDVQFLMTQGDPDLARYSPEYIAEFPAKGESTLDFDLVIIGDVASSYFEQKQMEWMVQQVKRHGGSLIMLGGALNAPQSYTNTPLEDLLPVNIEGSLWEGVGNDVVASPTDEGLAGRMATMGMDELGTRKLWAKISPLYEAPAVSAKPGSTVLVTLGRKRVNGSPYPLVSWHRFGSGKSMFVGTELLWRLRKSTGSTYHEKFWTSAIQFMSLSRLLGGNDRVTLEVDRNRYAAGDSVRLHADVLDDFLLPVTAENYTVMIRKSDSDQEPQELKLTPAPGAKGFFQGFYLPPSAGEYEVVATDEDKHQANIAQFTVYDESIELRRPAMRLDIAEQIAQYSNGAVVLPEAIASLTELIEQRRPRYERELSLRLWDHPLLYILLMLAAGLEWFLRRKQRLV